MSARRTMVHRCTVWRYTYGADDPYGEQAKTPATHLTDLPCYLWNAITAYTGEVTAADRDYVFHEYRMVVPKDTDVTEADYVEGVTDRRGTTINGSQMQIKAVIPRPDHLMLMLQEVT